MRFLLTSCICWASAFSTFANQPVTLLGPDLEPRRVILHEFSPDGIEVSDGQDDVQTLSLDQVLRLTVSDEPTRVAEDLVIFRLRDGQVLLGHWVGGGTDGESLTISLDMESLISLPLDDLLSVSLVSEKVWPATDDDNDRLMLTNGEILNGFIDEVKDDQVMFEMDQTEQLIELPMERIHAMSIANRPKPVEPRPGLVRVMTYNQTTLLLQDAVKKQLDDGQWVLEGKSVLDYGPEVHTVYFGSLRTIEPVSGPHRIVPLSLFEMRLLEGGEVFGVAMPPRVQPDGSIRLHAPVTVGFDLPQGARRLAFTAAIDLDEDIPEVRRAMAGCELVVYDGQEEIVRHTLTPEGPAKRLNLPLTSGGLRLVVEPGINGPVLDRVVLTRVDLLVSE